MNIIIMTAALPCPVENISFSPLFIYLQQIMHFYSGRTTIIFVGDNAVRSMYNKIE